MSDPITLPTPDEIAERIRACREELDALKKLQRLARTAQAARDARERRQAVSAQSHTDQGEKE
jgi:hypothetical protein